MDYMKLLRSLSDFAVCTHRCYTRRVAFVSAALLVGLPLGAHAAVLKINPDDNAGNVINLSGELSASVTHTADGMTIEIPGVEISLVCDTQTDPDECTVTIGSGSSSSGSGSASSDSGSSSSGSGSASSDSGSSSSGSGSSSSDSGDGDTSCDPALEFGCQNGTLGGSGTTSASVDTSDTSDTSGSGGTTGYPTDTTTSSSDVDDPCKGTGYRPNCVSDAGASTPSQGAFPTGGSRQIADLSGNYDYGSANPTSKQKITVASGTVTVVGLTMKSGDSPSSGSVDFAQASNISGVSLRAWISTAPDGSPVGNCHYSGYAEGVLRFSIGGTNACNLSAGAKYYFNMALCSSTANDLQCNQSGALAAAKGGVISVSSGYSD